MCIIFERMVSLLDFIDIHQRLSLKEINHRIVIQIFTQLTEIANNNNDIKKYYCA